MCRYNLLSVNNYNFNNKVNWWIFICDKSKSNKVYDNLVKCKGTVV